MLTDNGDAVGVENAYTTSMPLTKPLLPDDSDADGGVENAPANKSDGQRRPTAVRPLTAPPLRSSVTSLEREGGGGGGGGRLRNREC